MHSVVTGGQSREDKVESQAMRPSGPEGKFFTKVNETTVKFSDAMQSGRHILGKAGMKPADEYVLIQLLHHGTRSIGLDEVLDLREPGTEMFRAVRSDRIFRFTLNDRGFEWGANTISEPEIRLVGRVAEDEVLVLERDDTDIDLKPTDNLDLSREGTEHLHTEKRLITVYFENDPREMRRGVYTTEELKQFFGVQEGYVLEFINEEGQLTPLKPGAKLRVKNGMKFFEQVPCGGSS